MLPQGVFAQSTTAHASAGATRRKLRQFSYRDVKLTAGPLKDQFDAAFKFFMNLDNARILHANRELSGLPAPGPDMGGWYNVGAFAPGHALGQWISALSRFYAATGDAAARDKVTALVHGFGETLAGPKSFYDGHRFPAYCYDKHVIGLTEAFTLADISDARDILLRATNIADKSLPPRALTHKEMEAFPHKDITYCWDESYTLSENLFIAHNTFGDDCYLAMAKRFLYDRQFFEPLAAGHNALVGNHAYSHCNSLSSCARAYLSLGDDMHLRAVKNAWEMLMAQSYATGGWGPNETFIQPNKGLLGDSLNTTHNHFETPCGSYAHFKLSRYLLSITGDSKFGDSLERVMYNTILAAKHPLPDGSAFYYSDYHPQAHKAYHPDKWPCCSGTYPQVIADYLVSAYFHDDDGVYVNLYAPSELKWNGVKLTQSTDYPHGDRVTLKLNLPAPREFAVSLRIPTWCASPVLSVNQKSQSASAGGFARIHRTWNDGDTIELRLPMTYRTEAIDAQHPDVVALLRGPVVQVAVAPEVDLPRKQLEIADARDDALAKPNEASAPARFLPFYRVKDETYSMYVKQT